MKTMEKRISYSWNNSIFNAIKSFVIKELYIKFETLMKIVLTKTGIAE